MWPFQATADNQNGGHPVTTVLLMPRMLVFQDTGDSFGIVECRPPKAALDGEGYTNHLVCALPHPGMKAVKGKVGRGKPWGRPIPPIAPAPPRPSQTASKPLGAVSGRRKRPSIAPFSKR